MRREGGSILHQAVLQERCRRGEHDARLVDQGEGRWTLVADQERRVVDFDVSDSKEAVADLNAELPMAYSTGLAWAFPAYDGDGVVIEIPCPVCFTRVRLEARNPRAWGPCDTRAYREAAESALQSGYSLFEWDEEIDPEESRFLPFDAPFTPRTRRYVRIELQRFTFGCDCGQEWDDVLPKGYVVAPIPACPDCRERQPYPREVARMRAERDADQRLARRMGWPRGARGRAGWLR